MAARTLIEQSLSLGWALDDPHSIGSALSSPGVVAHRLAEPETAEEHLRQALRVRRDASVKKWITETLDAIAVLAVDRGLLRRAARLWGATDQLGETSGVHRLPGEQAAYDIAVTRVTTALGKPPFQSAVRDRRTTDIDSAALLADSEPGPDDAGAGLPPAAGRRRRGCPPENETSWGWSPPAGPTVRSPRRWCSARPRSTST